MEFVPPAMTGTSGSATNRWVELPSHNSEPPVDLTIGRFDTVPIEQTSAERTPAMAIESGHPARSRHGTRLVELAPENQFRSEAGVEHHRFPHAGSNTMSPTSVWPPEISGDTDFDPA